MPTVLFKGPFVGLRTRDDQSLLSHREASDLLNVRMDAGTIRKREGWTNKETVSGAILGMHDYLQNDGTVLHLVKAGSTLQKLSSWSATQIATGLHATNLADFATVNNRAYYVDGANIKVTDGTTVYDAQIARPNAPSVATGDPSVLTGDFDYKVTFYSSGWGQESPASDATAVVSPISDEVDLTSIPTSADGRVDQRRIYRRNVSANEQSWHLVHTITNDVDTSWADTVRDNDVDLTHIAPLSFSEDITTFDFRLMAYQAGVLFVASGDSPRIYFTRADEPWTIDNYITLGSEGDNELVTGLASFQGTLVVFKEKSIWILSGNTVETFFARKQISGVSTRAHHSIVPVDDLLFFLGERGFYAFDGQQVTELSEPIRPDVTSRNYNRDSFCVGVHDYKNAAVVWSFTDSGSSSNDKTYAYYYDNSRRMQRHSWAKWDMGTWTSAALLTDGTTRERFRVIGFSGGNIAQISGTTDDNAAIECYWETGKFDGGAPGRLKLWGELQTELEPQSSGNPRVSYYLDAATSGELAQVLNGGDAVHRTRLRRRSRDLKLRFWEDSTGDFELVSWRLTSVAVGRATA
jgi:hypothetical protein